MVHVGRTADLSSTGAARVRAWDWTRRASYGFTIVSIASVAAMVAVFAWESLPVWDHEGLAYLTGRRWFYRQHEFGALPMLYGTIVVSVVALMLAAPVGFGAAIFTAEIVPRQWRLPVKGAIELLAGVPSVVYGLLGVLFLRNGVYRALEPFDPVSGDTLLTAGLLLAVMILPTVMTLSDDALRNVPAARRQAARALGLTRAEVIFAVSLPHARRGMLAALILALGRAFGEGIAVFMVVGRQDNQWPASLWSLRPLAQAGQTLTTKLVGSETNIAYGDPLHWGAIVGLGLMLLAATAGATWMAGWLARPRDLHAAPR